MGWFIEASYVLYGVLVQPPFYITNREFMIEGAKHGLRRYHHRHPVRGDQPAEDTGRRPRGHQHAPHHPLHREQASLRPKTEFIMPVKDNVQRWDLFFVRGWVKFLPAPP